MDKFSLGYFDGSEDWLLAIFQHQVILIPMLLLAFDEAGFPLPIGDFIVTYTGYQVARGNISFFMALVLLLLPILFGASLLYYLSYRYGQKMLLTIGKHIDLDEKKLKKVEEKYRKYGPLVIIFGRHIPGFRVPITIFSGISDITYKTFILSVFVSVIFWIPLYLFIGMKLGPKALKFAHGNLMLLLISLIPILLLLIAFILLRKRKHRLRIGKHTHHR